MPFLEHFGLKSYPFALTPDSNLYFSVHETEVVLSAIDFSIMRGDGLLKVVGEVGTGKTLLSRLLMKSLDNQKVNLAYLNAPMIIGSDQIINAIAHEFKLKITRSKDPTILLREHLVKEHAKGKRNVLIIDEAQTLGSFGLEIVRLLSNLETETDKLLQIVLFGQPELERLLKKTELRQVLQRFSFSFRTSVMSREAIGQYLRFRLEQCAVKRAKSKKSPHMPVVRFVPSAINLIARFSGGVPRLVNLIADKALMAAFSEGQLSISRRHVRIACREMEGMPFPWSYARWFWI